LSELALSLFGLFYLPYVFLFLFLLGIGRGKRRKKIDKKKEGGRKKDAYS